MGRLRCAVKAAVPAGMLQVSRKLLVLQGPVLARSQPLIAVLMLLVLPLSACRKVSNLAIRRVGRLPRLCCSKMLRHNRDHMMVQQQQLPLDHLLFLHPHPPHPSLR